MPENSPQNHALPHPAECSSLLEALRTTSQKVGLKSPVAEDVTGAKLSYKDFWLKMHLLGSAVESKLTEQQRVGVMLPTSVAAMVTFFALHHIKRIPVMLNFSAGAAANLSAIKTAELDVILTSKAFIAKAGLEALIEALDSKVRIVYLEDVRKDISKLKAIGVMLRLCFGIPESWANIPSPTGGGLGRGQVTPISASTAPHLLDASERQAPLRGEENVGCNPENPAVILFTSGSEGAPKGVVLSHKNILSNIAQVKSLLDFSDDDKMYNVLPVFHSFGLAVGTLLPPICGFPVYFFPSPLQYKQIPPLAKQHNTTIFLSTDTFLRGYVSQASKEDFSTLRLVVAGAERLKPQTVELYKEKFGITVLQGYGVTETSPVASVNTPEDNAPGTVGKPLLGMEVKLKSVEGIEEGGSLLLKGPNVMLGYMKEDKPGVLQPAGEWYDTGDVVKLDADNRITITGRLKRFAKIGGEMVSLAVVEDIAQEASGEHEHAAVAIADSRKGEQIVLLTEDASLTREQLIAAGKAKDAAELYIPKKIHPTDALPRLGNGKINYMEAKKLVESEMAEAA